MNNDNNTNQIPQEILDRWNDNRKNWPWNRPNGSDDTPTTEGDDWDD